MKKKLTTPNETGEFKVLTKEEMTAINGGRCSESQLEQLIEDRSKAFMAAAKAGAAVIKQN